MDSTSLGWHVLPGEMLLDGLRRCRDGEDPDVLFAEWWANADRKVSVENVTGDELLTGDALVVSKLKALTAAMSAVLSDMECPHTVREYGNCEDCRNSGYVLTCEQDQDLVAGCEILTRTVRSILFDLGPNEIRDDA